MGSFGDRLKQQREQKSISLDDISLSTKIGTRMLRALEEEKFEQLPGGIFNKGFVRAYARHVGLDEEQTLSDYLTALGEAQQVAVPVQPVAASKAPVILERPTAPVLDPPQREQSAEIPWGLLALGLLLAALAFATWSYYHRERKAETSSATPTTEQAAPAESMTPGSAQQIPTAPTDHKGAPTTPESGCAARLSTSGRCSRRFYGLVEGKRGRRVLGFDRGGRPASGRSDLDGATGEVDSGQ
jgi:cytoskeletal protein RodZ